MSTPEITTGQAVETLCRALKNDPDFWMSWKANIAMPFQDEWHRSVAAGEIPTTREQVHKIANDAAEYFLWLLTKDIPETQPSKNFRDMINVENERMMKDAGIV